MECERADCDLPASQKHQADASCQIINNLSSGRIFIPSAIITLSLSSYAQAEGHMRD